MSAINTNESGFVNFSCRDWSFAGDKGTWIKYDDSTRTITVNVAAKGTISSKYLAELEAFAAEHGFAADFAAIRCGERRSITLPAPQTTEESMENVMSVQNQIEEIMAADVMLEWIEGVGSNSYGGGGCYRLYLDLDDNSLLINFEASSNTWLQRSDGSLGEIARYECIDDEQCEPYDGWGNDYRAEIEESLRLALQ